MKILLTTNLPYFPTHGGANTSNKYLLESFVRNNDSVLVVVPALSTPSQLTLEQLRDLMKSHGMNVTSEPGVEIFTLNGVEVHAVVEQSRLRNYLMDQIRRFKPDWTLVSTEDPSQNLLDAAHKQCPGRVIYLARTTSFIPFGPNAFFPSPARARLLEQCAAIVTVSEYVADYMRQWSTCEPVVLPISFYGDGPFANYSNFDRGFVTMINPCAMKGLAIFVEVARALPEVQFAAVPTWGTTDSDLAALKQVPNIQLLKPTEKIDEIYRQSRIILVPSLWPEGKSRVILESMLRGIPVLASDSGGNAEAKLGTDFLLPVRVIEGTGEQLDGRMLPIPEIPEQDIGPWVDALRRLLSDREFYYQHAADARAVAQLYVANTDVGALQKYLQKLKPKPQTDVVSQGEANVHNVQIFARSSGVGPSLADLTPEQKALLTLRLRKKAATRSEVFC